MTAVAIVPATLRDATYVAANMRGEDWREISCQCPDRTLPIEIAIWSMQSRECDVATVRAEPVAVFGVSNATPAGNVLTMWCWGTRGLWRAVPEITRWLERRGEDWRASGVTRVEARSIMGHDSAHRWMRNAGASEEPLPAWGKAGEDFVLFSWTRDTWLKAPERRGRCEV